MTLLWILLIVTFIFSAIFMLPTRWYTGMAGWLQKSGAQHHQHQLEQELARQTQGRPFEQDKSFFKDGVGLALDLTQRLAFVAVREEGGLKSAILPIAALRTHAVGERRDNGFYDYYVDLTVDDAARQVWRLVCGENPDLAAKIATALDDVKA
jgi:hypothetical protein